MLPGGNQAQGGEAVSGGGASCVFLIVVDHGISRKSYYKGEKWGLEALLGAVSDRSPGRSAVPVDSEKEAIAQSLVEAERQLLLAEQHAEIRDNVKLALHRCRVARETIYCMNRVVIIR